MILRALRPTDRAALSRLGAQVLAPFGDYQPALQDWLRHPQVVTTVAASERGRPVGFAMIAVLEPTGRQRSAYLLAIGVDEGHRRKGTGRQLLEDVLDHARRRRSHWHVDGVVLDVADDNDGAIALFRAAGFAEVPSEVEAVRYEQGQRALTMHRDL